MKQIYKLLFCLFIFVFCAFYLEKLLTKDDNNIISYIVNTFESGSKKSNNVLKMLLDNMTKTKDNPISVLGYYNEKEDYLIVTDDILDIIKVNNNPLEPVVYIFNTHQIEKYSAIKNGIYDFSPTVMTASYMLSDELKKLGIPSIVEERNITNELKKNNLDYSYSYRISKEYLENKQKEYNSLAYYIDIHRDYIKRESSIALIDGKTYAKIMFTVGKNRNNLEENLKVIKKLETYLEKKYPGITRSTYYVNEYSYNQEVSNNAFLIEIGSDKNTIDEVYYSILALADAFKYLIGGSNE